VADDALSVFALCPPAVTVESPLLPPFPPPPPPPFFAGIDKEKRVHPFALKTSQHRQKQIPPSPAFHHTCGECFFPPPPPPLFLSPFLLKRFLSSVPLTSNRGSHGVSGLTQIAHRTPPPFFPPLRAKNALVFKHLPGSNANVKFRPA